MRGDGVDLAVSEWGTPGGPATVLVHGYPDSSTVWRPLVAALRADDPERHVVAYDVRGAGASDAPEATAAYRLGHLVADLAAVVDATSPGRPVHLVGHDWGSIQAWAAVCDPHVAARFATFTSISGPPLPHVARWVRTAPLGDRLRQGARSWYVGAFQVPGLAPATWRHGLAARWPALLARREGVAVDADWPGPGLADDAARGVKLYRANRAVGPGTPVPLAPTLVLVPTDDAFVTPALVRDLPATIREVEGGHWVVRRHPERIAACVDDHIATAS